MSKLTHFEKNSLAIGIILICLIAMLIKSIYVPLRVYDNVAYIEVVADDGKMYGLNDCRIEYYLNGKVVIYHDYGEMQISDINNIKFYNIGEIKWKRKNKLN